MASSPVRSETKFMKRLKDVLKIKRRKNINYNAPTGQTPKSGIGKKKMASFREDTAANKKLQQETKDPNRKTVSYKRVTSKNRSQLSDQQKKKPVKKVESNKTKTSKGRQTIEAKNKARLGNARVEALKAKNKDFQAMKKGKMTKAQFIKKYPNSQTAKKARK